MSGRGRRPAVFLDRDGTINREVDYLADPDLFEFLPGAVDALRRLAAADYALVVVTNQSGIARGLLDEATLQAIHAHMRAGLAESGVALDWIGHCPHHPSIGSGAVRADCWCRKPHPGLFVEAIARLGLDADRSWCVGDSLRDLEAGWAVGARGILVRTGKGAEQEAGARARHPDLVVVDDLSAAVDRILA